MLLDEPPPERPVAPSLHLDVYLWVDHTTWRTYILDLLNLYPVLGGLLTPCWGRADVKLVVEVKDTNGTPVATYERQATERYWSVFASWYRNAYIEDAFRSLYATLFDSVADELARDADRLTVAAGAGMPGPLLADGLPLPESPDATAPPTTAPPRSPPLAPEANSEREDRRLSFPARKPFAIIREVPETPLFDGSFYSALEILGGIEIAGHYGFARVSSSVADDAGGAIEVAAGEARQTGYRIALYSAPQRTGFFWYPTAGFLSQRITLGDFRHSLQQVEFPNAQEVAAICKNPETGATIACDAPNIYQLDMKSGYAGLRAGYELVAGDDELQLFVSANAGLNLVEYRQLRAKVGRYDATAKRFDWVRSGAIGATGGLRFPAAHLAVRFIFDWEWYRQYRYAKPLEFDGPVETLDVEVDGQRVTVPRESRVTVDAAGLYSYCLQFAVAYVF